MRMPLLPPSSIIANRRESDAYDSTSVWNSCSKLTNSLGADPALETSECLRDRLPPEHAAPVDIFKRFNDAVLFSVVIHSFTATL